MAASRPTQWDPLTIYEFAEEVFLNTTLICEKENILTNLREIKSSLLLPPQKEGTEVITSFHKTIKKILSEKTLTPQHKNNSIKSYDSHQIDVLNFIIDKLEKAPTPVFLDNLDSDDFQKKPVTIKMQRLNEIKKSLQWKKYLLKPQSMTIKCQQIAADAYQVMLSIFECSTKLSTAHCAKKITPIIEEITEASIVIPISSPPPSVTITDDKSHHLARSYTPPTSPDSLLTSTAITDKDDRKPTETAEPEKIVTKKAIAAYIKEVIKLHRELNDSIGKIIKTYTKDFFQFFKGLTNLKVFLSDEHSKKLKNIEQQIEDCITNPTQGLSKIDSLLMQMQLFMSNAQKEGLLENDEKIRFNGQRIANNLDECITNITTDTQKNIENLANIIGWNPETTQLADQLQELNHILDYSILLEAETLIKDENNLTLLNAIKALSTLFIQHPYSRDENFVKQILQNYAQSPPLTISISPAFFAHKDHKITPDDLRRKPDPAEISLTALTGLFKEGLQTIISKRFY